MCVFEVLKVSGAASPYFNLVEYRCTSVKFGSRFLLHMRTPAPSLGPQHRLPEPVPILETHLKVNK